MFIKQGLFLVFSKQHCGKSVPLAEVFVCKTDRENYEEPEWLKSRYFY